jgi:hypothetical protein
MLLKSALGPGMIDMRGCHFNGTKQYGAERYIDFFDTRRTCQNLVEVQAREY